MDTDYRTEQGNEKRFHLSFSLDRDGYFRHECGKCGRQFKTKSTEDQLVSVVQPAFSEVDLELTPSSVDSEADDEESMLECPYCGYRAGISEMLTQDFAAYMRRFIYSEYLEPQIHEMLRDFSNSMGRSVSRARRDLFSIEISAQYNRGVRSARPISGPDAPDMIQVQFLCCDENMKVESPFKHISNCPFCHEEVILV